MKIKVRTNEVRFTVPIPVSAAGLVVKLTPERVFIEARAKTPEPYRGLITKENLLMLLSECKDIIKENKDLEIIQVEAADGTSVSVKL